MASMATFEPPADVVDVVPTEEIPSQPTTLADEIPSQPSQGTTLVFGLDQPPASDPQPLEPAPLDAEHAVTRKVVKARRRVFLSKRPAGAIARHGSFEGSASRRRRHEDLRRRRGVVATRDT